MFGECLSSRLTFGMAARFAENLEEVVEKEGLTNTYEQEMKEIIISFNSSREEKIRQDEQFYNLTKARRFQTPDDYIGSKLLALSKTFQKDQKNKATEKDDISSNLIWKIGHEFKTAGRDGVKKPAWLKKAISYVTDTSRNHKSALSAYKAAEENKRLCQAYCTVFGIKQQDRVITLST